MCLDELQAVDSFARAIAHRLSTIAKSDKILVLDGDAIIERGAHSSLIAEAGFYANLVRQLGIEETS